MYTLKDHFILAIAVFVLVVTSFISLINATQESAIIDEVAHIAAGYSYVTQHDMRLNPEHPPLLKILSALPLLTLHADFDTAQPYWTEEINDQWVAGQSFLYQSGNSANTLLFTARLATVAIFIALGVLIFIWVRKHVGSWGGLFALTLYAFDPNILGHNHYVTTDLAIAAAIAATLFFFLHFLDHPSWKNALIGGLFLGIAHVTKFSSIALLPVLTFALFTYPLLKDISGHCYFSKQRFRLWLEYFTKGVTAFLVSILVIWGTYALAVGSTPRTVLTQTAQAAIIDYSSKSAHAEQLVNVMEFLNQTALTRPLATYTLGLTMVFEHVDRGHTHYFMNSVQETSSILYFPTVFVLKETLPILLLLILTFVLTLTSTIRYFKTTNPETPLIKHARRFTEKNFSLIVLFGFVIFYAYLSITSNLAIGFRHLFPILPILFILIAISLFRRFTKKPEQSRVTAKSRACMRVLLGGLILWHVASMIFAYPHFLGHFNAFVDQNKGYLYVTDSNIDWGQELKRLNNWIGAYNQNTSKSNGLHNQIEVIRVDYFGGGDPKSMLTNARFEPWWQERRPIEVGFYAISTFKLQESLYRTDLNQDTSYRWLDHCRPFHNLAGSILIYLVDSVSLSGEVSCSASSNSVD